MQGVPPRSLKLLEALSPVPGDKSLAGEGLMTLLCPHSEESYLVQDYAQLDQVQVRKLDPSEPSLPGGSSRSSSVPHPFQVNLLHNSEGRQEQIVLSSDSA